MTARRARVHFAWIQPSLDGKRNLATCSCGWTGKDRARVAAAWSQAAIHQGSVRGIRKAG